MDHGQVTLGHHDLLVSVKDQCGGQIDWHHGRFGQEKVVESDHVFVAVTNKEKIQFCRSRCSVVDSLWKHVTEPSDDPRQGKDGANLTCLQKVVQVWMFFSDLKRQGLVSEMPMLIILMYTYNRINVIKLECSYLHCRGHKVFQVCYGQLLRNVVTHFLSNHQQEGDGNVMVTLVVMQLRMLHQHPDNQSSQLILKTRPFFVFDARGKTFQTSINIQYDLNNDNDASKLWSKSASSSLT